MTETEFRARYERLRGQLPWGPDDRRGALNYITPAEILAALREPTLGRTVSLAAPVEHWPTADNPDPARHEMQGPLGADAGRGLAFSMDRIAMNMVCEEIGRWSFLCVIAPLHLPTGTGSPVNPVAIV